MRDPLRWYIISLEMSITILPENQQLPPPQSAGMRDQYGRRIRDLRVSLTDRCNLRCVYCMPQEM